MERDDCSPHNVTLGYYVTSGKTVYVSSLVVEALNVYGFDKLLSDIRQHIPLVKAVLVPVATWLPTPSIHLQLKTGDFKKERKGEEIRSESDTKVKKKKARLWPGDVCARGDRLNNSRGLEILRAGGEGEAGEYEARDGKYNESTGRVRHMGRVEQRRN